MRYFHMTRNMTHRPVINLDKLWTLVPAEQREGLTSSSTEVPVIDTLLHGYGKVLGKGRLPQLPCIVKARWVSELAEKKIKEAGGVVVVRSARRLCGAGVALIPPLSYSSWPKNDAHCPCPSRLFVISAPHSTHLAPPCTSRPHRCGGEHTAIYHDPADRAESDAQGGWEARDCIRATSGRQGSAVLASGQEGVRQRFLGSQALGGIEIERTSEEVDEVRHQAQLVVGEALDGVARQQPCAQVGHGLLQRHLANHVLHATMSAVLRPACVVQLHSPRPCSCPSRG